MLRVRVSRAVSRRALDRPFMVCSVLHWRQHRLEPWIDRLFFWDWRHCGSCAEWEINEVRRIDALGALRRAGRL